MSWRALGLLAAVLLPCVACGPALTSAGRPELVGSYRVSYQAGSYNSDVARRELAACAALPGVGNIESAASEPPTRSIEFSGSQEQARNVEGCLRALTAVKFQEFVPSG